MPLLYWCKTELFYVTWRTPLWTQELSRLFLKYWNSSYVWNTTHNCSCLSWKYNSPLGFDHLRLLAQLGTAPGERWWPRAARRTHRDCRTPPTKPTSHWRPSRPTEPLLEARPLVFDSLFWSANNVCELSLAEFPFNEAQGLCQSETNTQTTLIVEWDNKPKAYPEVWVWTIERVDARPSL